MRHTGIRFLLAIVGMLASVSTSAEGLEDSLKAEGSAALARAARDSGDARRGALLFHQARLACAKCHPTGESAGLGPNLTRLGKEATDESLVESVLFPSKVIGKEYVPVSLATADGQTITGLLVDEDNVRVVLRPGTDEGRPIVVRKDAIEERSTSKTSFMPAGQVNQLTGRQDFLDLVGYLIAIRDGGSLRARELQPTPEQLALVLPEYESRVDHAGLIAGLDQGSFERGEAIYNRLCVNCHGTATKEGSLPTSLRFASGRFKNGAGPYAMYQTLTRGYGMMAPQTWMVPRQKYDVIHYIREAYLKERNPSQYVKVGSTDLATLPRGDTRGPEPRIVEPWVTMDYGPTLLNTYEVGSDGTNFAYKGIAVRLDPGPGGVSRGHAWTVFDHDTLRVAASWTGEGFIDWNGIHFNGQHQVHPRIVGEVQLANPSGPGWADPETGRFDDERRVLGRDGKYYGPLPRAWGHYKGLYHHGRRAIVAYTVGTTEVLEEPGLEASQPSPVFTRTFNVGPRPRDLILQVARHPSSEARIQSLGEGAIDFGPPAGPGEDGDRRPLVFDGKTRVEIARPEDFNLSHSDFTITARIKTRRGGTIFAKAPPGDAWAPDGKTFFVRDGRLCFDIGWVGVVTSRRRVDDGRWHAVAATWDHETARLQLAIDGLLDAQGALRPKGDESGHSVRVGFTATDFPGPDSYFVGALDDVRFYQEALQAPALARVASGGDVPGALVGHWRNEAVQGSRLADQTRNGHDGSVKSDSSGLDARTHLLAGLAPPVAGAQWLKPVEGNLRLRIPSGNIPLKFTLWTRSVRNEGGAVTQLASLSINSPARDLSDLTHGGPPRWPERLTTFATIGRDDGPFAVDILATPENNPWLAQVRPSGFDFFPDGDRAAVSTWDGDVWLVSGLNGLPQSGSVPAGTVPLTWRRIASGLFQPLGVKIVRGAIYLTCRDELVVLRDLNGDEETDYYENVNNDHQVTEHFHEFAMGLQVDASGNFYYAKSARHALPAIVPHHGTLLRISPDGSETKILATGFRAANGVCLNPDGTFFVTDQEGHWTPKNRINLVKPGGFYGNMFGYHGVTDSSDAAMEQPLCWITNRVDRSPAELLWVEGASASWGPLKGALLNLSYGNGKVFVVLREALDGQVQGGVSALPVPAFPTGIMRGRFHPGDGQLYTCGLFAWAGDRQQPGGFYRIRATGKPLNVPIALHAHKEGMEIRFTDPLDRNTATDVGRYTVTTWSLKRTANYGSEHHGEHRLKIAGARLSEDGRTVFLDLPEIESTWCMEIAYVLKARSGEAVEGSIDNTIHKLAGVATFSGGDGGDWVSKRE